ncbi:PAS domain S-box protein [Vibrio parahaemolyticus]|nr:PAS domain S-box protein [Vibrio parahaemolyticus]
MNLDNWSLRKKLRSNFLLFVICFLSAIITSLIGFKQVSKQFDEVAQDSVPDIVAILELKSSSKRLFAEIQGFVATGDEDEVEEFQEANELFDQWYQQWTVDKSDTAEFDLKLRMAEHKDRFNEFAQSIYELEFEKAQLLEEFVKHQELIEENTEDHHSEITHHLHDSLSHLYKHIYSAMLTSSEEEEEEHSNSSESEEDIHQDASLEELIISINERAAQLSSVSLTSSIQQVISIGKRLIEIDELVRETLESVEDYEEDILETLDKAVALQTTEVEQAFDLSSNIVDKFVVYISILAVVCLALSLFVFRYVTNLITSRLAILVNGVTEVTNGNLDAKTKVSGLDELGRLGHSFDIMTDSLRNTTVSKEYLDNIIRSMTESLIVTSESGTIEVVNSSTLQMLGYEKEDLLGKSISVLFHDSNETLQAALDGHPAPLRTESQYLTKSGKSIDILLSNSRLVDNFDKQLGIVFVAADISRLKQVQRELEETNTTLQTTQSQLIQASKLASIGELSAGVAHELNQPLMVIRNGGQMLERRHKKGTLDDDRLTKYIESVLTNSKRMMKIINHLRTFSRRSSTEFNAIDVNKVIHDSFFMVSEQLRLHDISVSLQISDTALQVLGEPNQLEQVILNLVGNARDALDSAGSVNKQLTITTQLSEDDDKFAEILVADNGHGIPEEVATQIFDPFYTTKEEGKGTGLGLSISYGIITAHHGTIDIAQTSEVGTTMRIRLPIINPNA